MGILRIGPVGRGYEFRGLALRIVPFLARRSSDKNAKALASRPWRKSAEGDAGQLNSPE
jgi:hypothetical protein